MKNMLSKLGTKKVAGAVLAAATLLVGVGVVSNFSGSGQKAANEAALSRFSDSAYNNFSGSAASRAALERQMNAGQDMNTARFLRGKDGMEDDAYSSDGAYAEGVRGDEGFVYGAYEGGPGMASGAGANGGVGAVYGPGGAAGADGAYQPFNSTYDAGDAGNDFSSSGGAEYGAQQFKEISQQASAAVGAGAKGIAQQGRGVNSTGVNVTGGASGGAGGERGAKGDDGAAQSGKGSKGAGKGGALRPATQINKLSSSNGSGSSFGGGAGGAKGGGSGSSSFGGGSARDSNTRALPQNPAAKGADGAKAFQFGRGGAMGGYQVGMNGGTESNAKGGNDRSAANSLLRANMLSGKAMASQQTEGAKQLADSAFDGQASEGTGATIATGATVGKVANALRSASSNSSLPSAPNLNPQDPFQEIDNQMEGLQKLNKDIKKKYAWTLVWTICIGLLALASFAAIYAACGFTPLGLGLGALAIIPFMLWLFNMVDRRIGLGDKPGISSVVGMINQMGSDKFDLINDGINIDARITQAKWFGGTMKVFGTLISTTGIVGGLVYILTQAGKLDDLFKGLKNDDFSDEENEYSDFERHQENRSKFSNNVKGFLGKAKDFMFGLFKK